MSRVVGGHAMIVPVTAQDAHVNRRLRSLVPACRLFGSRHIIILWILHPKWFHPKTNLERNVPTVPVLPREAGKKSLTLAHVATVNHRYSHT